MSVINQMLRDLDQRQASEQERAGLPPRLRTLPPAPGRRADSWRMLLIGAGIGALVAGGLAAVFMSRDVPPVPTPTPVARPPRVIAPPSPALAPAPQTPLPVAEQPAPPPAELGDMKLSTLLSPPAPPTVKPEPVAQKPAPRPVAKPAAKLVPPGDPVPAPAPDPVAPPAAVTPAEAQIDKRPKGGQAHEMADAEYRKGMQAARRGDIAAARTSLQRALQLDPAQPKPRQALLSVLVGARQWQEARQVAESGLALDPAQTGWAVILARLQFEQGDAAAALATLERHAAHADRDAEYQSLFGYLLQRQQRPAEAAERFKAALALRPAEGRWWFGLATALEAAGSMGEAKTAYARAREVGNLPAEMAAIAEQKLK